MSLYEITAFSLNYTGPIRNLTLITSGYLKYDEREVYSPTAKFGYEEARDGFGRGVHFRCLHNNKYLVRQANSDWITATATEPVEETNRRDCTLFRLNIGANGSMSWTHVNSGRTVAIVSSNNLANGFYLTISTSGISSVTCTPIDVERIIKLPKIVVFKGDNDKYLIQSDQMSFAGDDRHRKDAWFETFPLNNGDVRFRSVQNGQFWRRDGNGWILANSFSTDTNTAFQIARLGDNTIALINRGNNRFCQRMPATSDQLKAEVDSGVREAGLSVEEPIVDRRIEVEYRLDDARVFGERPRSWLSQVAFNAAKEGELETTLTITYTESLSFSFNVTTTVSTNLTSTTTVEASVPLIAKGSQSIEVSAGIDVETGFGKTEDKSESYEFSCKVLVPPGQKRRARVLALEAKCDVPFTYVQTDVQANGDIVRTNLQDGLFKGMNGYEFHVQVYDPDQPTTVIFDEPVATRTLPDTYSREKIYLKKN
ncbi:uncharacterized protein LOC141610539 isoform X3 [Silene latifolia]|uniref:uncharacterized protein LOC141610539 isoform X3 n=1 Tax=Silene latifolia TaxID=37657 RepID=UPI003D771D31